MSLHLLGARHSRGAIMVRRRRDWSRAPPAVNRRALFGLAPLLLLPPNAQAQQRPLVLPLKWYVVQVEGDAFTVEMPGIPDHRIVNDVSARGTAFALHTYSLESSGYSYVVQTALYPGDVDISQPRRLIQAAIDERAKVLETRKWSKVDWRDIAGSPAADSTGFLKGGNALRQLVLLKGRRFVSLAFMGAAAGMTGVEAERFFKSLKMKA